MTNLTLKYEGTNVPPEGTVPLPNYYYDNYKNHQQNILLTVSST